MSLNEPSIEEAGKIPLLRTAEHYLAWRTRVADKCWSLTGRDITEVTDKDCITALRGPDQKDPWVHRCWVIITSSLHDDLLLKLTTKRGLIQSVLTEINACLLINTAEEVQPLRHELYGATMQREGENDLQTYIAYLSHRQKKLIAHEKGIEEDEMVSIFLKGLHPIYQALQIHFATPGNMPKKYDAAVEIVRRFSAAPAIAVELAKLKTSATSQSMFPMAVQHQPIKRPLCRLFSSKGSCRFGANCKFMHTSTPNQQAQPEPRLGDGVRLRCAFCYNRGHVAADCRKRLSQLSSLPTQAPALVVQPTVHPAVAAAAAAAAAGPQPDGKIDDPFALVLTISSGHNIANWVMDSGATCNATYDERDCIDVHDCDVRVTAAGCEFTVSRIGTAQIKALDEKGHVTNLTLSNCLISPKFPYKLLSIRAFTTRGHTVTMNKDVVRITNQLNDVVLLGIKDDISELFVLKEAPKHMLVAKSYGTSSGSPEEQLWRMHLRHGHRNFVDVARQYNLPLPKVLPSCTSCVMGKSHIHPPLSSGFERATRKAEGFHSDFKGPFTTPTPQGYLFLLTIIDDYSRRIFGFLCKSQGEWLDVWTKFVMQIEAELGRSNCISWILTDCGVYRSKAMAAFCAARGIQQRFSAPHSHWMNHTAERNMRTIGEMAITTMIHANTPKATWGYAMMHAIDVINRTAESAQSNSGGGFPATFSRLERWKGHALPGQTKGLYPFGCLAFKHVPAMLRGKLDAHATPTVYLGIDAKSRSYLLGSLFHLQLSVSVEVTFLENVFPFRRFPTQAPASLLWGGASMDEGDARWGMFEADPGLKTLDRQALRAIGAVPEDAGVQPEEAKTPEPSEAPPPLKRSARLQADKDEDSRLWWPPSKKVSPENILAMISEGSLEQITPKNAQQAVEGPAAASWLAAMNREKACHIKNGTFGEEWDNRSQIKPIPADWVFRIKHRGPPIEESKLEPKQFKARVVIRGQYMKEGLDYNDTFAPVAKPVTIRALLALATANSFKLFSGDVETAFLTSDMDCDVWVKMPPFWGKTDEPISGSIAERRVRRLLKGVPGIPQGSRLFYHTFAAELRLMNYLPSKADKCLFLNEQQNERTALVLWVDDFIFMCQKEETWTEFHTRLRQKFTIPNLGPLRSFLGMEIVYDPVEKCMHITQSNTIDTLLGRAGLSDCNPSKLPCQPGMIFSNKDCPPNKARSTQYAALIALANFIACWTRPDIAFTVNKLCKFMANPGEVHWQALKYLLRYLRGTRDLGLQFKFTSPSPTVHGYSDASFADCPDTSRSTVAYVFFFGDAILSWYSKLHTYVTTCTNHSEYAALYLAAKEAQWLKLLFAELAPLTEAIPIYVDNSGVVSLVFNPVDHQANKHVRIACHYVRELVDEKIIAPQRVATKDNLADLLTKPLSASAFKTMSVRFVA